VLGAILGFFGGGIGFASYAFGRDRQVPEAVETALFFVLPPTGLALGGLVGAVVGSVVGRFFKFKLRPQAERIHEPNGWVVAGLFLGFILGGMVGAAFVMLVATFVGPGRAPIWLIFPTFFAFPVLGLIGGVIAGGRIHAYRAKRRSDLRVATSYERIGSTTSRERSPVATESQGD
jgi:hypothetical protein